MHAAFVWDTLPGFLMGLNVELTDFPSSDAWGTRLWFEAAFVRLKYLHLKGIIGYATRNSKSGGLIAGWSAAVNF